MERLSGDSIKIFEGGEPGEKKEARRGNGAGASLISRLLKLTLEAQSVEIEAICSTFRDLSLFFGVKRSKFRVQRVKCRDRNFKDEGLRSKF